MENWICIQEFLDLSPKNVYRKEWPKKQKEEAVFKNLHILFRKIITVSCTNQPYRIRITADDSYKLYINGRYVGQGPAMAYHDNYNYNVYDISSYLVEGKNTVCAHTYYHGLLSRSHQSGDLRQGMWAEITEGEKLLCVTDDSWKYCIDTAFDPDGEVLGYDTQFAENIDMTKNVGDWMSVEYDDSRWKSALVHLADDHILIEQITPGVQRYEVFPKIIKRFDEERFLLDFGKEIAGCIRLNTRGRCGSKVYLYAAEELGEDGHARYNMRCNVKYQERWTLSGNVDIIENYAYKAFRYLEVCVEDRGVLPEHFSVLAQHFPVLSSCEFECSDARISAIWAMCKNAVIVSAQEEFVDCPTREKGQYLGDLTVTSVAHSYLTGDTRLFRKALMDFANSAFICKGLMAVAPGSMMQEIADFSLLYPLQVYYYYQLTGDKMFVQSILPVVDEMIAYFGKYQRADGLIENITEKWNLVDWPNNLRDNYDFELTNPIGEGCHAVINEHYYGAQMMSNTLHTVLGQKLPYDTERLKDTIRQIFYSEEMGLFVDAPGSKHASLHVNALALFWGIAAHDEADRIVEHILEKGLNCGVFFAYFVLKGLVRYERYKEMTELMLNDSAHSWLNMLAEGATACFEAWGKEQKWNTSLCHPWGCAPILVVIEDLLGVRFQAGQYHQGETHFPQGVQARLKLNVGAVMIELEV